MRLSDKIHGISTNINLIRFIAAIFVIFSHSFYVAASREDPLAVFSGGQVNFGGFAVAIFFFLSGFYVTKSLYKKNDVKEYLYKRCMRIFPQLWVVVLLTVFVLGPVFTTCSVVEYFTNSSTYLYLLNGILLPIHNLPGVFESNVYDATVNGPLWTMPVEFAAYLAMAVFLLMCKYILKNEKLQKACHIMCVCALIVVFVILDIFVKNDFLITVVRPMLLFFVGVLYCDHAEKIKLNFPVAFLMLMFIGLSCKIGLLNYAMIICLPYVVVTLALGTKQVKINSKILVTSYEMYLFGWPIQQVVVHYFGGSMSPYLNCLIVLPIDIMLAYILYIFIEKKEKNSYGKLYS